MKQHMWCVRVVNVDALGSLVGLVGGTFLSNISTCKDMWKVCIHN